jgi:hypothetical protein
MFRQEDELAAADIEVDDVSPAFAAATATKLKCNAMKLFIVREDGTYNFIVKNVMRFTPAVDYISIGMSLRQTAAAIEHAKIRTKTAKLSGIKDYMEGQFIRVLAISLQKLAEIHALDDVWALSLTFDGSTHRGSSLFDVRTRFFRRGYLYNLHLIALPMFERHTSNNIPICLLNYLTLCFRRGMTG